MLDSDSNGEPPKLNDELNDEFDHCLHSCLHRLLCSKYSEVSITRFYVYILILAITALFVTQIGPHLAFVYFFTHLKLIFKKIYV